MTMVACIRCDTVTDTADDTMRCLGERNDPGAAWVHEECWRAHDRAVWQDTASKLATAARKARADLAGSPTVSIAKVRRLERYAQVAEEEAREKARVP